MNTTRPLLHTARLLRPFRRQNTRSNLRLAFQRRYQSSEPRRPRTYSEDAKSFNPVGVGAIAGGVLTFAFCYTWYHLSGTKSLVNAAQQTKKYLDTFQEKFEDGSPAPNEALKWLRQTATTYAAYIPGATAVVNIAFDEVDDVHDSNRKEVDSIINECCDELKQVNQTELNVTSAKRGWEIVVKHLRKIHALGNDAMAEVLDRHPELKDSIGEKATHLRRMASGLGPEAKQIVEQARNQVAEIAKNDEGPLDPEKVSRIRKIVLDTTERVRRAGDDAWRKSMLQAKPCLDSNPHIKQLVERNVSALKQSNTQELLQKIKNAADTGNMREMRDFVRHAARNARYEGTSSLQESLKKVPGGDEVLLNMSKMHDVAQRHGTEAENLFKSTISEISQILSRKAEEAKSLDENAEREATRRSSWFGRK